MNWAFSLRFFTSSPSQQGVCEFCAVGCHEGHKVREGKLEENQGFYCDCGSTRAASCQILGKKSKQKKQAAPKRAQVIAASDSDVEEEEDEDRGNDSEVEIDQCDDDEDAGVSGNDDDDDEDDEDDEDESGESGDQDKVAVTGACVVFACSSAFQRRACYFIF